MICSPSRVKAQGHDTVLFVNTSHASCPPLPLTRATLQPHLHAVNTLLLTDSSTTARSSITKPRASVLRQGQVIHPPSAHLCRYQRHPPPPPLAPRITATTRLTIPYSVPSKKPNLSVCRLPLSILIPLNTCALINHKHASDPSKRCAEAYF